MKLTLSVVSHFFALLVIIPAAQATDARYCSAYARKAVQQQVLNIANNCGNTGLRWSSLYRGQKDWCLGVRQTTLMEEDRARQQALFTCGIKELKPIDWLKLPNQPSVWDHLFAQELIATRLDDVNSIRIMHQFGVDLNHDEGFNNGTTLYHAIGLQAEKIARYVIDQGVNPNRTSNGGENPLVTMMRNEQINYSLLQFLLSRGTDPDSRGELGVPPELLNMAIDKNDMHALLILLRGGADPNLFDEPVSVPPLILAINKHNMNAVFLLINSDARVNLGINGANCKKDEAFGDLPLDVAIKTGLQQAVKVLRLRGAKSSEACKAN